MKTRSRWPWNSELSIGDRLPTRGATRPPSPLWHLAGGFLLFRFRQLQGLSSLNPRYQPSEPTTSSSRNGTTSSSLCSSSRPESCCLPAVFYLFFGGRFGTGKTNILRLIADSHRRTLLENVSVAALARTITERRVVCIDEFDVSRGRTWMKLGTRWFGRVTRPPPPRTCAGTPQPRRWSRFHLRPESIGLPGGNRGRSAIARIPDTHRGTGWRGYLRPSPSDLFPD